MMLVIFWQIFLAGIALSVPIGQMWPLLSRNTSLALPALAFAAMLRFQDLGVALDELLPRWVQLCLDELMGLLEASLEQGLQCFVRFLVQVVSVRILVEA